MKNFKITDLMPKKATFNLSIPDKSYSLRPCTPKDLIDLKEIGIDVEKVVMNPISADICKIVLFLMEFDDAKEFKRKTVKTINIDTGEEEVEEVGGFNLLLKFVANLKEQMEMFFSLLRSLGFEEKAIDELKEKMDSEIDIDKKENKKKVKKKKSKQP